jgi:hypothetical protein
MTQKLLTQQSNTVTNLLSQQAPMPASLMTSQWIHTNSITQSVTLQVTYLRVHVRIRHTTTLNNFEQTPSDWAVIRDHNTAYNDCPTQLLNAQSNEPNMIPHYWYHNIDSVSLACTDMNNNFTIAHQASNTINTITPNMKVTQ